MARGWFYARHLREVAADVLLGCGYGVRHLMGYRFWKGAASLAGAVYERRHEPAMWLIGIIIVELIAFLIIWGPLLRVL